MTGGLSGFSGLSGQSQPRRNSSRPGPRDRSGSPGPDPRAAGRDRRQPFRATTQSIFSAPFGGSNARPAPGPAHGPPGFGPGPCLPGPRPEPAASRTAATPGGGWASSCSRSSPCCPCSPGARSYASWRCQDRDKTTVLPALRGSITGANGQVLAMTVATYEVTADPPLIPAGQLQHVADSLRRPARPDLGRGPWTSSSTRPPRTTCCWRPTTCRPRPAARSPRWTCPASTRAPATPGPTREGDVAANIIGFTGTRNGGVLTGGAGVELEYNALLAGQPGSEQVQIGTDGQQIPLAGSSDTPVVNGSGLRLTIVPALQYAAEQACADAGQEDQGEQLHGGDHPAAHRRRAGHGAVADVRPGDHHGRGPGDRHRRCRTCSSRAPPPR